MSADVLEEQNHQRALRFETRLSDNTTTRDLSNTGATIPTGSPSVTRPNVH